MHVPSAPLVGCTVRFTGRGAYTGRQGVVTEAPAAGQPFALTAAFALDAARPGGLTIERTYHVADLEVVEAGAR